MMPRSTLLTVLVAVALALAAPSVSHRAHGVQQVKSLYTAIDLKACEIVKEHEDGDAWLCEGLKGYPVYIAEGDHRTFLSTGARARETRAAEQTLSAFNSLFEGSSTRTTVEWRFVIREGEPVPYATIVRYFTQSDGAKGEVLIVARVTGNEVCHVAYIDAKANPDAIVMARRVADQKARAFDCGSEPKVEGAAGKSPM